MLVGWLGNSLFGDDSSYVFCRGHIESRIFDFHAVGRNQFSSKVRDLSTGSLLDRYLAAYGPESAGVRRDVHDAFAQIFSRRWPDVDEEFEFNILPAAVRQPAGAAAS